MENAMNNISRTLPIKWALNRASQKLWKENIAETAVWKSDNVPVGQPLQKQGAGITYLDWYFNDGEEKF